MFSTLWHLYEILIYLSVFCKVDMNLTLRENSKGPSSSTISIEPLYKEDSNEKRNFVSNNRM